MEERPLVIKGGTLIDGTGAPPLPNSVIVIRRNRIEVVGGAASIAIDGAQTVDANGKTILPGLIDLHVHLGVALAPVLLSYGVTTARDTGGNLNKLKWFRQQVTSGKVAGPRLFYCGPLLDGENPLWQHSRVIRAENDATIEVDRLARSGVWGIKTYVNLSPALLASVINRAHQHGLPVTGHLGASTALEALEAGIDGIEHVTSISLRDLIPNYPTDERRQQFLDWASLDLNSQRAEQTIQRLAESAVYIDPTLVVFQTRATNDFLTKDPEVARLLPVGTQWLWRASQRSPPEAIDAFGTMQKLVGSLHAAGARIVVGSDTPNPGVVPGLSLHRELALLVEAGLTPMEAIVAATRSNAEALGKPDELGTVEPGKLADLVVLERDPSRDITAAREVHVVVKDGKVFHPQRLRKISWSDHIWSAYYYALSVYPGISRWRRWRRRKS